MLTGYKTYIIAAVILIVGLVEGFAGIDVPGVTLDENWGLLVLNALGLGTLRAGMTNSIGKAVIDGVIRAAKG